MFTDKVNKECFLENFGAAFFKALLFFKLIGLRISCAVIQLGLYFQTIKKFKLVNKVLSFSSSSIFEPSKSPN